VALSGDGRRALTGGTDGVVRLWDTTTRKSLGPPWHLGGAIVAVGFGPGGKTILAACNSAAQRGTTWLWEAPAPVDGSPQRLQEWVRVVTGLQPDGEGMSPLGHPAWEQAAQHLQELGGPPQLETFLQRPHPRGMR
jgi:WD40 repeat protein